MKVRIQTHFEDVVRRAAALSDVDPAAFTRLAAYKAALETIAAHEFPLLRSIDPQALLGALDSPPEPNGRFRLAFETCATDFVAKSPISAQGVRAND